MTAALRTIPGPGPLATLRLIADRDFLEVTEHLWREHGDVFQLRFPGRRLILAVHPEVVRHVSITGRESYDKLRSYDPVRRYLVGDGIITATGEPWRKQRKLMAPFYTPRGVQAYAGLMLRDAVKLGARWEALAAAGTPVEIGEEMTQVTAAIILGAMFSTESSGEIHGMREAVETMIAFVGASQSGVVVPTWVPTRRNRRYLAARELVHRYIGTVIAARNAVPEDTWPDDLLSRLMRARDEDSGAPMGEALLRDEAITTFFAGHETTARTMTFAWYALAANPGVAARLHAELDRVLGDREPTVEDLRELPYTLRVVKEVLRLYPPAPFYVRDVARDDVVDGRLFPAGAALMLSPYLTHRHPGFWPDPGVFEPDRFTPALEAEQHPGAYHPFAAGQRICIGNNFSLLESHLLLAVLARRFNPRLVDGHRPRLVMRGTLGVENGLPMIIERRAPAR